MTGAQAPTLDVERELMRGGFRFIAGMDEVGRGALAGPVSVGVVMIDATCASVLPGVRDSKLLSAAQREALISDIEKWCVSSAVGHAGPADIDRMASPAHSAWPDGGPLPSWTPCRTSSCSTETPIGYPGAASSSGWQKPPSRRAPLTGMTDVCPRCAPA